MHNQKRKKEETNKYCLVLSQFSFIAAHTIIIIIIIYKQRKIQVNTKKKTKKCLHHVSFFSHIYVYNVEMREREK
jgi:uncharacterized membrane protein